MKPVAEPVRTSRTRQKVGEPATLGRSAPKDPAREQARRQARDKDIKPTRSPGSSLEAKPEQPTGNRKPSRSGRSMKSRQSEPRASRSGKRTVKARQTIKPPIVLMVVAAILVALGLILLPRAYQPSTQSAAAVRLPSAARANLSTRTVTPAPTQMEGGARIITTQASQTRQPAMNLTPPRAIEREQIVGVQSGIPPVILFRDGSKLNADPVTLEQLPADVRLQLTYNRSRP